MNEKAVPRKLSTHFFVSHFLRRALATLRDSCSFSNNDDMESINHHRYAATTFANRQKSRKQRKRTMTHGKMRCVTTLPQLLLAATTIAVVVSGFVPLQQQRRVSSLLRPFRHLDDPTRAPTTGAVPPPPLVLSDSFSEGRSSRGASDERAEHDDDCQAVSSNDEPPEWQQTMSTVFGEEDNDVVDSVVESSSLPSHSDVIPTTETTEDLASTIDTTTTTATFDEDNDTVTVSSALAGRIKLISYMSFMDLLARLDQNRIPYDAWASRAQLESLLIEHEQACHDRVATIKESRTGVIMATTATTTAATASIP